MLQCWYCWRGHARLARVVFGGRQFGEASCRGNMISSWWSQAGLCVASRLKSVHGPGIGEKGCRPKSSVAKAACLLFSYSCEGQKELGGVVVYHSPMFWLEPNAVNTNIDSPSIEPLTQYGAALDHFLDWLHTDPDLLFNDMCCCCLSVGGIVCSRIINTWMDRS